MAALEEKEGCLIVRVRVQPKASRDAMVFEPDGRIRVALTAPPVEGAANKALCAYLAKRLGVPKRAVTLMAGETSREKTLRVEGVSADAFRRALES
jgi:hypothetical protein